MFFSRLRRQAKWIFLFMALVFIISFVVFGVGTGGSGGLSSLFNNNGKSTKGTVSESDARKRIKQNPKDAAAYRELATALETKGDFTGAISALDTYVKLRPKSTSSLTDLAGLYTSQAARLSSQVQAAYAAQSDATANTTFSTLQLGKNPIVQPDVISQSVSTEANNRYNDLSQKQNTALVNAMQAYQKIAKITPRDATVQLELGQASQQAGSIPIAIAAYKKFLKLAPADPSAPLVRKQVKALEKASRPRVSTSG